MVLSVPLCGSSHKVVYSFQFWMQRVLLRSKIGDQFIDAVIALTNLRRGPGREVLFIRDQFLAAP